MNKEMLMDTYLKKIHAHVQRGREIADITFRGLRDRTAHALLTLLTLFNVFNTVLYSFSGRHPCSVGMGVN